MPATKAEIQKVLSEIFDPFVLGDEYPRKGGITPPTYREIVQIAKLIAEDESEETFQRYLAMHPNLFFRLVPSTDDSVIGFLCKPPISNFNFADFMIFTFSQGGDKVFLIEIERPSDCLFTRKLTPARKLTTALGQVDDWKQWIQQNKQTFLNTTLRLLTEAPEHSANTNGGSFKYWNNYRIENLWKGFGGNDYATLEFLILIGRWSKLTKREQERLIFFNQSHDDENLRIRTYDNFIRRAIEGPKYFW